MSVERDNPYGRFNFTVEIEGIDNPEHAGFSEVSGLDMEVTPIEYRAGNDANMTMRKLPGLNKYPNVVLKRGITGSMVMYEWLKGVIDGTDSSRHNVVVVLLDEGRNPVMTWKLQNAFPVKLEGPSLSATGNEVAIETLELAHEKLTIE